ncbi:MAG: AbrB/MazE/SpoVT family DNA-binding domain-containing protein [Candidatus Kerfeldbacteria bacterium]|nr:AbrB/MazE/SpoVT family DNA-binding domain-containing protein [Candidatus Kerfeldbacteria bacterium]
MKKSLTSQSSITTKYQTVIPAAIRQELGIKMHEELIWQIIRTNAEPMVLVSRRPKNWAQHLSGLGKRVWEGVDTDMYLKQLKKEWQK